MLTVTEWAEKNRVLPRGTSARPGPWVTESYQREILDCLTDPEVQRIVFRKSTQVGWSEILNNIIGYFIDADPKPIMMVQPTDGAAKNYSKKRITPMIEACPALRAKVREATARRAGNTIMLKEFDGGSFKMASARSGASLRGDPLPILLLDEADAYPLDIDGEGSPIEIAEHRTLTWDDAKILIGSTPKQPTGLCVIDAEYKESSQGMFYVPCPMCGFMQPLLWRDPDTHLHNLIYERNASGDVIPESVHYLCKSCRGPIDERFKVRMLDGGRWVHQFPERRTVRGFHINALYSVWRPIWAVLARKWAKAKGNPEKLKTFINLSLGESWDEGGQYLNAHALSARKEKYAALVPMNCCVLVGSVDVQTNRLEYQVTGFGPGDECWLIAHEVFWGDPGITGEASVWDQLNEALLRTYKHEAGAVLSPVITLIDSGSNADAVYDFVLPRQNSRLHVYACKGVDFLTKPGLTAEGTTKRHHIRLWNVSTYAAKDRIFARLKIAQPGPGYAHFPEWVTDEYLEQLTSEKKIPVINPKTRARRYVYIKEHTRNEALDLTVYAHAALFTLQNHLAPSVFRDLGALAEQVKRGMTGLPAGRAGRAVRSSGI